MAERPKAEEPMAERAVPWWQRVLRRALGGLRSGFGLFRRSSAGRSTTEEEAESIKVEADRAGALSIAAEPQEQDEAEPQITERHEEEETELNRTFPNPRSNSEVTEEQAIGMTTAEIAIPQQSEPGRIAAGEPHASDGPEPTEDLIEAPIEAELQNPEPQIELKEEETELNETSPSSESKSKVSEMQAVESAPAENADLQQPQSIEPGTNEQNPIAAPEPDPAPEPIEAEPPAEEEREVVEPVADPPHEEATVAEPEEEANHEESDLTEHEPAQEDSSLEIGEAAPEREEPRAETDSALEPELASGDAPLVSESIQAEEFPEPEGTLAEALPVIEGTNIGGGEGAIEALQPGRGETETAAESQPETEPEVPNDSFSSPESELIESEPAGQTDAPSAAPHSAEAPVAESEELVAESETPVEPEASASKQEAAVAKPEAPAAEPETSAAELPPVVEPPPPAKSPVQAEPSAEERKKAEKVAAAVKARSQSEEQSPFSVMVGQVYEGPLDLLLDLIRKQDIDIYDIPIAKITAQFLAYVDRLRASDMDVAGDFIYTAALLIHIKSKMLLPRDPAGPDDAAEDPRHELVERLLEHERFKNAAQMLQQKQLLEAATWTRSGLHEFGEEADAEPEIAADTVDLVRVFREVLERARNRPVMDLEEDAVTVGQMIRFLARRLTMDDRPVALRRLLSQTQSERMLIAMFLALLEMVRLQAVLLRQDRQFSDIFIKKHTGFDALLTEGLENAKDDWR
jgi:segregation and condensation protein A